MRYSVGNIEFVWPNVCNVGIELGNNPECCFRLTGNKIHYDVREGIRHADHVAPSIRKSWH
jgi:hypothetical protein